MPVVRVQNNGGRSQKAFLEVLRGQRPRREGRGYSPGKQSVQENLLRRPDANVARVIDAVNAMREELCEGHGSPSPCPVRRLLPRLHLLVSFYSVSCSRWCFVRFRVSSRSVCVVAHHSVLRTVNDCFIDVGDSAASLVRMLVLVLPRFDMWNLSPATAAP